MRMKALLFCIALMGLTSCDEAIKKEQEKQTNEFMQDIGNQVAADAVKQYEIAVRGGDTMQMYTQASMVTQAYLQAKDEVNYKKWLKIEKKLARKIGLE